MSEASPYAIEAFVEILKNQAGPEKGYRTIRDKNFEEKDYYSINHYDCGENPKKSKEFVYVHIPEENLMGEPKDSWETFKRKNWNL